MILKVPKMENSWNAPWWPSTVKLVNHLLIQVTSSPFYIIQYYIFLLKEHNVEKVFFFLLAFFAIRG